jgi:sugar/nucleoside kinase (ribokinase family)
MSSTPPPAVTTPHPVTDPDPAATTADVATTPVPILLGTISLDRYVDLGFNLPGGGVLNMAWHWRQLDQPYELISRIGAGDADIFEGFLTRHAIPHDPYALLSPEPSSSIDIRFGSDRQPYMDNFIGGVWETFRCTPDEERRVTAAPAYHTVLVEGAIEETMRLGAAGLLPRGTVSADFLGFRHYTPSRMADTLRYVDLAFVGWPGSPSDTEVAEIAALAAGLGRMIVITFGAQGVRVVDGRTGGSDTWYDVRAIPVAGTTVGCGDAFIAAVLAEWWRTHDAAAAVAAGAARGALATAWNRPIPDDAYGPELAAFLARTDAMYAR